MKNKWIWAVGAILVLITGCFIGLKLWFLSPGIRVFGNEIHAEVSGKCYIIDEKSNDIVDETTISINGSTSHTDRLTFDGDLKIIGYENSADGIISSSKMLERNGDGCWSITQLDTCTHQQDYDGIVKPMEHFCDYHYTYYLFPEEPELVVVLIDTFEWSKPQYAIMADSEQQAIERYEKFLNR